MVWDRPNLYFVASIIHHNALEGGFERSWWCMCLPGILSCSPCLYASLMYTHASFFLFSSSIQCFFSKYVQEASGWIPLAGHTIGVYLICSEFVQIFFSQRLVAFSWDCSKISSSFLVCILEPEGNGENLFQSGMDDSMITMNTIVKDIQSIIFYFHFFLI